MPCVFVAPYLNKYLFYCHGIYRSIEIFVFYTLLLYFFQNFNIWLFSSYYYYIMELKDFWPIFRYEFKLNQIAAETAQKFVRHLVKI